MPEIKSVAPAAALKVFAKRKLTLVDFERDGKGEFVTRSVAGEDGKERAVMTPVRRALGESDILKATDYGDGRGVVIVTADGQRYCENEPSASTEADASDSAKGKA